MKLPPPIYYLLAILLSYILDYLIPIKLVVNTSARNGVGILLVLISILIIFHVLYYYRKYQTAFDVRKAATHLIIEGPNRYSRNPGYLSLTLLFLGLGIFLENDWIVILTPFLMGFMNRFVICTEERELTLIYGDEYLRYKMKVRRWL